MQEEEERREVGEMTVAVQETFSFTWNMRAREGQGSESAGQSPQPEEVRQRSDRAQLEHWIISVTHRSSDT